MFLDLVNISEPPPSLDMYQTSKRGLQVLLWTDLLKGEDIFIGEIGLFFISIENRFYDCTRLDIT